MQRSSGFGLPAADDDDSDSISLASTIDEEYPPDREFVVDEVRSAHVGSDGGVLKYFYLVEWANFPIDECTWEPEDSLSPAVKDQWKEKAATEDPSVAAEFEQKYHEAYRAKLEEKRQRHRRRNAKRRKLGLDTTNFYFRGINYPDSEDETESVEEETHDELGTSSDDAEFLEEAEEDNVIDQKAEGALLSSKSPSQSRPRKRNHQNRIFTFNPTTEPPSRAKKKTAVKEKETTRPQPPETTSTSGTRVSQQAPSSSKLPSRQRELPSTTGYQGSARMSGAGTIQTKPPQRSGNPLANRLGNACAKATTSGSAVTKKPITAKKSGRAPIAVPNIFIGGAKRKPRQNLGAVMTDSSKDPKLFAKFSIRRKAEHKGRDRDDQAPDLTQVAGSLFNIRQVPPLRRTSGQLDVIGSQTIENTDERRKQCETMPSTEPGQGNTAASEPKPALVTSKRNSLSLEVDRPRKKAKSVRFTGEDGQPIVISPMDIDEGPALPTTIPDCAPTPPLTETKTKLSVADYRSRSTRSVGKRIVVSAGQTVSLGIIFDGIPKDPVREADQQWLQDFLDADCLHVGHTVLAESLVCQLNSLRAQDPLNGDILCSGTIISVKDSSALETLAEHLRVRQSGMLVSHEHFNIVFYPTQCDALNMDSLGIEPASPDGIALKYFTFKPIHNFSRLIRPLSARPDGEQVTLLNEHKHLFERLLGFNYSALVAGRYQPREHHFFLVFPEAAIEWYMSICCWLSACNAACKIYTNFDPGSWSAFLEKADKQCGVVIIHEAAVSFVRRFPSVAGLLLDDKNFSFWCFSESVDFRPILSDSVPVVPTMLSRIFPLGKVILVTPSFIISEPRKTYELLSWFLNHQTKNAANKLVLAYGILDYLRDLSGEKAALRLSLRDTRWKTMSQLDAAVEQHAAALTEDDLAARQKSWMIAQGYLALQIARNGEFSEENHVVFADRSIDANDEQSLVNWFGWWSLARADQYRKFFVLGSSGSTRESGIRNGSNVLSRASRSVKIPNYDRSVLNDPDEVMRAGLKVMSERSSPNSMAPDGGAPKNWFMSRMFENNEHMISKFIASVGSRGGHLRTFAYPISWADLEMADHFGDNTTVFATYKQWLHWPHPWQAGGFNTYIAFFHTIQEDWAPEKFPRGLRPRRHPWLVIYRPVEPHNSRDGYSHGKNELIIWDVRAGNELEGKLSIELSDLTWMQRELIQFVQNHAHEQNPGFRLARVYLGGFKEHQAKCQSTLPADQTAEFLQTMTHDLKWTLPSTDRYLRLIGFRSVSLEPTGRPVAISPTHQALSEDAADTRLIFHPPRGSAIIGAKGMSKCTNDLYEKARLARLRDWNAKEMDFTFRPTMEWYADQVAEGRQYEHILVDCWEKVFAALRIGSQQRLSTSEQVRDSLRTDSVTSSHSSPSIGT